MIPNTKRNDLAVCTVILTRASAVFGDGRLSLVGRASSILRFEMLERETPAGTNRHDITGPHDASSSEFSIA